MVSLQSTVDFMLEQIGTAGTVSAKKMFGDYGIFCNGKMVALVCDNQLFVKLTWTGTMFIGEITEDCPYPGSKPCFLTSGEKWDDREWLTKLTKLSATETLSPKKKSRTNPPNFNVSKNTPCRWEASFPAAG